MCQTKSQIKVWERSWSQNWTWKAPLTSHIPYIIHILSWLDCCDVKYWRHHTGSKVLQYTYYNNSMQTSVGCWCQNLNQVTISMLKACWVSYFHHWWRTEQGGEKHQTLTVRLMRIWKHGKHWTTYIYYILRFQHNLRNFYIQPDKHLHVATAARRYA